MLQNPEKMGLTPNPVRSVEDLARISKNIALIYADSALEITQQN